MKEKPPTRPTIRDVARLAGVSIGSVSRVLNTNATVALDVRRKVEKAIDELSFRPDPAAQSMRSRSTRTVGCIVRNINLAALAHFVRAAHDVLLDAGYALLLSNSEGNPERERHLISVMAARRADALIIAHHSESSAPVNDLLKETKLPVILVDREIPTWADSILIDHRNGVARATTKLLELGHKRIALLTGHTSLYPSRERVAGFKAAFKARKAACDERLIRTGSFEGDFGFETTSLLLSLKDRPTAIIAGGVDMLPGVIRAIRIKSLLIPRDVSLVGTLDSDLTELLVPSISVEQWDYAEVGRLAARFALNRIANGTVGSPSQVIVPTEFLQRDSIAPPKSAK